MFSIFILKYALEKDIHIYIYTALSLILLKITKNNLKKQLNLQNKWLNQKRDNRTIKNYVNKQHFKT